MIKFCDLVHNFMIDKKLTMREFCKKNDHNWKYISAIKRGITPVPDDEKFLKRLEYSLQLDGEDRKLFWLIARRDKGIIYYDMKEDKNLIPSLPLPIFKIGDMDYNREKFMEFVEEMRNSGEFNEEERY